MATVKTKTSGSELSPEQRKLVEDNQYRVVIIARGFKRRLPAHVELDELVSWGNLRLVECALRFDSKLSSFPTFAQFNIRGAMLDFLRSIDMATRHERRSLGGSVMRRRIVSVDSAFHLGKPDAAIQASQALGDVRKLIGRAGLTPRMAYVIEHWLLGERKYQDVAAELGVAAGSISHIAATAVRKMREAA